MTRTATRRTAIAAALLAAALPTPGLAQQESGPRTAIVPLIDAHQHMMGPAALSTLVREPSPPAVAVPAEIAQLLRRREHVDAASYDAVFMPAAQLYAEEQGRWWRGEALILDALGNFGTGPHRFIPTAFAADGAAGYVAGIIADGEEETHNFVLGLVRGADGQWRIGSEMKQPIAPPVYGTEPVTAERIIAVLDDADIKYGVVLSTAYWFGDPGKAIAAADRRAGTRAENDWVLAETARHPDRLIAFCGVNPLADYAIAELERCAARGARGMKIHRNSRFTTADREHVEKLRRFFRAANAHRLAIVIHLRDMPGVLIEEILPEAPDIPIQIAHMGSALASLEAFAEAIAAGKPGTANLWFDWTQALPIADLWTYQRPGGRIGGPLEPGEAERMAGLMRRVGLGRVLYGSDMPLAWNPAPREWWRKTILTLPLSDAEIRDIADNLPPYVPGHWLRAGLPQSKE